MEHNISLITTLAAGFGIALLLGFLAERVRVPALVGYLLAGNVLVETIFAWPGLGFYAWNALTGSDYDAIQGFVLIVAVIYVFLNFFVDLAYTLIDPRIRLA